MTNIKVTVEYEKPEMSKIDALIEQYVAAEKVADATISETKPIIEACGRVKYEAICEQLYQIGEKLRKFCLIGKRIVSPYIDFRYEDGKRFEIKYDYKYDSISYLYNVGTFNSGDYFDSERNYEYLIRKDGLVTNWNKYNIINELNISLEKKIQSEINSRFNHANEVKKHLDTMLK